MPFTKFTMARADLIAALVFVLVALFIMWEGMRLGPGWGDSGPQAGFFPFSLAVLIALGGIAIVGEVLFKSYRGVGSEPFFEDPREITELLRVGIPIAIAIATVPTLGLYLMAALYSMLFALWYGQFRWYSALLAGILIPSTMYLILDYGLRISMPRSIWYGSALPI